MKLQKKTKFIILLSFASLTTLTLFQNFIQPFSGHQSLNYSQVIVHRFYKALTKEHFFTLNREEGLTAGFVEEPGFSVFKNQVAGTLPIYRCYSSNLLRHFISQGSDCEGQHSEGMYGYVFTSKQPGTTAHQALLNIVELHKVK